MISYARQILRTLLVVAGALVLTACSKTVQWEEEVSLDTGETIWVERTDSYVKKSEPGNPMKQTWWLHDRTINFVLNGQRYSFNTAATEIFSINGVNSKGEISIVSWTQECEKKGYAEYRWTRDKWEIQSSIEPSLVGIQRNLMAYYSPVDGVIPKRVLKVFRDKEDNVPNRGNTDHRLDVSRIAINCNGRK